MELGYLWDTNIVIYYLQGQFSKRAESYIDKLIAKSIPAISVITEIELLCWNTETKSDLQLIKRFIKNIPVVQIDDVVKNKTIEIRRIHKIKLPDAIIAASAIVNQIPLVTHDSKDFKRVKDIYIIDPFLS